MSPRRSASRALGRFFAALRERSFVVSIIALVTVLYGLGLVVPQRRSVPGAAWEAWRGESPRLVRALEVTGLADVYAAPGTYVALAFFFLSLGAVVVERFPRLLRRTRLSEGLPLDPGFLAGRKGTLAVPVADAEEAIRRAAAFLRARGYRLHAEGTAVRGVRFRVAPLGFVLFHGAFALILVGGILLDLTRFSAVVNVAEGERFDFATGEYAERPRVPRVGRTRPDVAFTVLGVRPRSEAGFPMALEVTVQVDGVAHPRVADINAPVEVGTASLIVVSAGAAPLFTCEAEGRSDGAYVKLLPNATGRSEFVFEPCGLDVLARPWVPDAERDAAGEEEQGVMLAPVGVARLEDLAARGIEVAVRGGDDAIARGVLRPGGSIATPDGRRVLHMPELRLFARLQIVDERGGGFLWAGFLLGTLGLVLRLVLFRREVVVVADPAGGRALLASAGDVVGWRPDELLAHLAAAVGASAPPVERPPAP